MRFLFVAFFFLSVGSLAQSLRHPAFPQEKINRELQAAYQKSVSGKITPQNTGLPSPSSPRSVFSAISRMEKFRNYPKHPSFQQNSIEAEDTIYVGEVPHDTLIVTGTQVHTGPVFVFNDGVLFVRNATVTNYGDVYVFGHGKFFADSSSLTFPQTYFYQRGLVVIDSGFVRMQNCQLNYSGLSHNLFLGHHAMVEMENIHQNDWTTCGMVGAPTLRISNCNIGGEIILNDQSKTILHKVDTLLLWHHFPDSAQVNYAFPDGDTVNHYVFSDTVSGVNGLDYTVLADSCHNVMWGMMPVNGSEVTISNSVIRAIGAWFRGRDTVAVSGLFDNSTYTDFTAPLADRHLRLINTPVQTWSLYVFDSSQISIDSCRLGEVGTQHSSSVLAQKFLLDGSGGYFWATDTTIIFASGVTVYSAVRSERDGIFLLGYSWLPFSWPTAIGNSLLICVQTGMVANPVPYDNAVVWMTTLLSPDSAEINSVIPIPGRAWIDQGPQGGWMFFENFSLHYQKEGQITWTPIIANFPQEIHGGNLESWITVGLTPGNYRLRLLVRNNFGDSITAQKEIKLLPAPLGVKADKANPFSVRAFPNPSEGAVEFEILSPKTGAFRLEIINSLGENVHSEEAEIRSGNGRLSVNMDVFLPGIYLYKVGLDGQSQVGKLVLK